MPEDGENGRREEALLAPGGVAEGERLMALVLDGVASPESRRAYERGLREFLSWLPPRLFTRASVQEYRAFLEASGRAPSTINLRLAPIRKLALEASDNGLLDPARAVAIARVKGVRRHGVRLGNWVGAEEAGRLLATPFTGSLRGRRDRAILAVLLGCALRRSELVALRMDDLQEREGRAVFADIVGKGGRVRTVPVPQWVREAILSWTSARLTVEMHLVKGLRGVTVAGRAWPTLSGRAALAREDGFWWDRERSILYVTASGPTRAPLVIRAEGVALAAAQR